LIGDPETDYQVSRTGYQNAQTNRLNKLLPYETKSLAAQEAQRLAAAAASTAQGGLYDQKTTDLQTDAANLLALSQSPELAGVAASMFDLGEGANLSPEVGQSILYRLFQEGDANSIASALATMGEGQDFNAARGVVLDESADINERIIANALLGNAPVKYSKPDFAQTELEANNQTDLQQTGLTAGATVEAASINANATTAYQNYKSDLQFGVGGSADREGERKTAQAQWEHENATLEINVEPGKQVILSPKAGERLGLEPNDEGLYVLDGGPKPGSIVVKVGEEDVYLTEADAKALGIEKNDAGTYMIPGRAKPTDPDGSSKSNYSVPPNVDSSFQEQLNVLMDGQKLPLALQLQIKAVAGEDYSIGGDATRAMKKLQEAFGQLVTVDAPGLGNKTYTTTTTLEETREAAKNGGKPAAKQMLLDLEYSEDQANEIMKLAGV
jgi:hypothetical protein